MELPYYNNLRDLAKYIYSKNYALQALDKFRKGDTSTLTSVPDDILRQYQQAVFNKEYERNNPAKSGALNAIDVMNMERDAGNKQLQHKILKAMGIAKDYQPVTPDKYFQRVISYENYNPVKIDGVNMVGSAPTASFGNMVKALYQGDPSYNAQNTVGSAKYIIDDKGNVRLIDRYNINKGLHMGDWLSDAVHTWAKHQPQNAYNVDLNLGNINDWNLQYTGNDFNRNVTPDTLLGRSVYDRGYEQ
jgi:hypothetical protein